MTADAPASRRWIRRGLDAAPWVRGVCVIAIVALAIVVISRLPLRHAIIAFSSRIAGAGAWGAILFALIAAIATVLLFPPSVLKILAGVLFGMVWGTLAASIGTTIGAAISFLLARHVARRPIERLARRSRRFDALDHALGAAGWRILVMWRLSPAVPHTLGSYLFGLTRIGFWPFVLTTWVATLPLTLAWVYVGHIGGQLALNGGDHRSPAVRWILLGVGLLATAGLTIFAARVGRQALREQTGTASKPIDG